MSMGKMCGCKPSKIGWILVIIGALNWGLYGVGYFFGGNWNVVNLILGNWMWLENLVYILVGVSGAMLLMGCKCDKCKMCNSGMPSGSMGGGQM